MIPKTWLMSFSYKKGSHIVQRVRNYATKPRLKFDKQDLKGRKIGAGEYALLIIPVTTFGLGVWQVKRMSWKEGLINEMDIRTSAPPVHLPFDQESLRSLEFCQVYVKGEFEHENIIYIGPRSKLSDGAAGTGGLVGNSATIGFHVVTPFKLENSDQRILVNRGWVSKDRLSAESRGEILPTGPQELIGLVRLTERKNKFMPENNENIQKWTNRDVEALANKLGTLPIFLDASSKSNVRNGPLGGQTLINLPNDHLGYLVTWFSLSAATTFLWLSRFVWK